VVLERETREAVPKKKQLQKNNVRGGWGGGWGVGVFFLGERKTKRRQDRVKADYKHRHKRERGKRSQFGKAEEDNRPAKKKGRNLEQE